MFVLKEILKISPRQVCFCGRKLIGDLGCEVHGIDIRVDTQHIDARLQIVNSNGQKWENYDDLVIDVSLPSNQFVKLFKRDKKENYLSDSTEKIGVVHYEVFLPKGLGEEILSEFIELSEFRPFFGYNNYLIRQERIKWKSAVSLYFILAYKIIPLENVDRIILTYSGIPLRRISDYINWRLNQCKADPENIQWSLLNSHSSIYQYNGYSGYITKVDWDQNKKLPSKIYIQSNNDGKINISKLPYQLFQGCQHFVIGRNQQYKARMALEHIGYQLTQALGDFVEIRYKGKKTSLVENRKLERYDQQFDNLIGSNVRLQFEQLQKIGELQNKQLMRTSDQLTQIKQKHTKNLLVVSCSATKVNGDDKLPALLRYAGITYCILKTIILGQKWPLNVDLLIVSAKYGLLTPFQPIPYYDQRITPEIIEKVKGMVNQQLNDLDLSSYSECFVNLSKMYSKSITELYNKLETINCHLTRTDNYIFQKRNIMMANWLEQRYSGD